ncbi:hypothetical protein DFP73DRAFT_286072 [Morchella snyderi]|nr:hypothetical protein DFP73DRAFT_286072 [Morchella snyderi]
MIRGKLRVFVVSSLVRDCKGMFLLAQLYIEHLCQQTTESQVRKAMEKLKATVKTGSRNALLECYGHAIDRIREQSPSRVALAWRVLGWLVKTKLKPSIDELRAVVSVDNDMTKITEADMPETGLLVEVCAGLVTVEQSSNSVQLVHYTVEEYMESITVAEMSLAPGMILMSSTNYLRMTGDLSDTITSYILETLDHYVVNYN